VDFLPPPTGEASLLKGRVCPPYPARGDLAPFSPLVAP